MSLLTLEAKLERTDPATPWGFRMQGGKDYGGPLAITKVNGGSLAAKCGVHVGDLILKIGNLSADVLKHKEAQDTIVASGNKLDLLLQRGGSSIPSSVGYDMFSPPNFNRQGPASGGTGGQSQNYNASAKPFGSSTSAPVDNLTNRLTQGLSMNSAPSYQPAYDDDQQHSQSGSFNRLKNMMDSGQVPSEALKPLETQSSSSVQRSHSPVTFDAAAARQYNNPVGLYSTDNVKSSVQVRTISNPSPSNGFSDSNGRRHSNTRVSSSEIDEHGKRKYSLSETYKLVHERENSDPKNLESPGEAKPTHSKSFQILQDRLEKDSGPGHGKGPSTPQPAPVWGQQAVPAGGRAPQPPPPSTNLTARPWQSPAGGGQSPGGGGYSPGGGVPFPHGPAHGHAPGGPVIPTGVGAKRGQKGDAVFTQSGSQSRIPICASCGGPIRGPFVMAMGKTWCPDHFVCANPQCGTKLLDIGFVEEGGFIYCERDYEMYFAPHCTKCGGKVVGSCVKALDKDWHPGCFLCFQCKKPISGTKFHVEDGNPYCEDDWKKMYQTQCIGCGFAIEPGDRWVEAMNNNYHAECFNCSLCQVNLDGKPFVPKGGKPYCKTHGR